MFLRKVVKDLNYPLAAIKALKPLSSHESGSRLTRQERGHRGGEVTHCTDQHSVGNRKEA